jgi:hypothetical protein
MNNDRFALKEDRRAIVVGENRFYCSITDVKTLWRALITLYRALFFSVYPIVAHET